MSDRGTPQEHAEFAALSSKIADKLASESERARWRELRAKLAPAPPPPKMGLTASASYAASQPQSQQRAHVRATKKLRFSFTAEKAMPIGFSDEVSAGGLRLTLHHHVDVGALFVFRLQLGGPNDPAPLTVTGKVAWAKREGNHFTVGIEFVGLRPEEKERIDAYSLAPKEE